MRRSTARRRQRSRGLRASDFRTYLVAKAGEIAPTDVTVLVAQATRLRQRAARDAAQHAILAPQVELALGLLGDHVAGRCPQIPYQTVALLTAALLYYLSPIDVIPDFVPGIGTSDDALVLQLAFTLGSAGIGRYCAWKGIDALPAVSRPSRRTR
jgi:uncharacterized membrane protein YkvA (DUF1232 family)